MTKAMISSPVNKEEEKEMEEEEEEKVEEEENKHQKEEEEKIRTTMQSSIAMPQSCIHGPKQLFLSSKLGSGGGGDLQCIFCSTAAELKMSGKAIVFFPVSNEKMKEERRRKRRRRRSSLQCSLPQQCSRAVYS